VQLEPSNDKQAEAIKLRDQEQREFYEGRILLSGKKERVDLKGRKLVTDNFTYRTENTINEKGETVSNKIFDGGYQVVIND